MPYDPYLFYEVMNYPAPFQKEFFAYEQAVDTLKAPDKVEFSWAKPCEQMEEYIAHVDKLAWLWRSLPFVEAVYLANSITFNALHDSSDIDLFIVTSEKRIWTARWVSAVMFFILGLKRGRKRVAKKYCLSFYVSKEALNLQKIRLFPSDPYLIYRIAHLVPLYQAFPQRAVDVYEANYWLRDYLPSFPMEHVIKLGNKVFQWRNGVKIWFERVLWWRVWNLLERVIKLIRVPIILLKKKQLGAIWETIVVSDEMLKFHADKRKAYAMKWKIARKS